MWTVENRARYARSKLRYPSDLTDEEWALAKLQIPRAKRGGNKRTVDVHEVMTGLMYVLSTGCQWRAIPNCRREAPSTSTSAAGNTTARSTGRQAASRALLALPRAGGSRDQPDGGHHRQPERQEH